MGPLILETRRLRDDMSLVRRLQTKYVLSHRVVSLLRRAKIAGIEFAPVVQRSGSAAGTREWCQPLAYDSAQLCSPTRVDHEPFDETAGSVACPRGHLAGLNLLSEVFIEQASRGSDDLVSTSSIRGRSERSPASSSTNTRVSQGQVNPSGGAGAPAVDSMLLTWSDERPDPTRVGSIRNAGSGQ